MNKWYGPDLSIQKLVDISRKEITTINIDQVSDPSHVLKNLDSIAKVVGDGEPYSDIQNGTIPARVLLLEAFILPEGLSWSTFDLDLVNDFGRRVYFHRCFGHHEIRVRDTLDLLINKKRSVAWVGIPGIGKTYETNAVFLDLIQNIDKPAYPKRIILRKSKFNCSLYNLEPNHRFGDWDARRYSMDLRFVTQKWTWGSISWSTIQ